jgi:hypothetical protein
MPDKQRLEIVQDIKLTLGKTIEKNRHMLLNEQEAKVA